MSKVITPSAQYTKLCEPGLVKYEQLTSIVISVLNNDNHPVWFRALVDVMYSGGLRVSEALQINTTDILKSGRIRIKSLKNSNDRIVMCSMYSDYFINCKVTSRQPFNGINRFFVRREFIKLGLILVTGKNKNNKCTHVLRNLYAHEMNSFNMSLESKAAQLGHKSTNSTKYYGE